MKNLVSYNENCFQFYKLIIKNKRKADLKTRLELIINDIEKAYKSYNSFYQRKKLEKLIENSFFDTHKSDLLKLYAFDSSTVQKLKSQIDDLQPNNLSNTCQNCTINSVNSMDHVLGKSKFPQFSVHPYNLFPSCTECNGHKSSAFAKEGKPIFLNLYIDNLPDQQYLYSEGFINSHGDFDYKYIIENRNNINSDVFNHITSHYIKLHLLSRMKSASIKNYGELRNTIKTRLIDLPWNKVKEQIQIEANLNILKLGTNHFQYILNRELIINELFKSSIEAEMSSTLSVL